MSGSVALYEALKSVNVPDDLARAAAGDVPAFDVTQLATKADVADLRQATKTDVAELRMELRTAVAELRTEMAQQGNRIVFILGGLMALLAALVRFLPAMKP